LSSTETRPTTTDATKIAVWAAAAGRCTFCNQLVTSNEDLGELVAIGELAHNVGWGRNSPRGDSDLTDDERQAAENLLLLCRTCHKPIDQNGVKDRFSVMRLAELKREHESRIQALTDIGADRKANIIRLVGPIRGANPELTYETALEALTAAKLFPALIPGAFYSEYELDLRHIPDFGTPAHFAACASYIDGVMNRVNEGVRHDEIRRLAVFAFARIPILVHLGASLDDKVPTRIFQRHRTDTENAWNWPSPPPAPPTFTFEKTTVGNVADQVALVVNLSGTIDLAELPGDVISSHSVYQLSPDSPAVSDPSVISSPQALANLEKTLRSFLATVEAEQGKIDRIALFPAIPLAAAVTLGRVLMPEISPAWQVFDRNDERPKWSQLQRKKPGAVSTARSVVRQ